MRCCGWRATSSPRPTGSATSARSPPASAHEINQPLAAIRTFAENARQFLDRANTDNVRSNLNIIVDLTARIAAITAELRSFFAAGHTRSELIEINAVVNGALLLVSDRMRSVGVTLKRVGERHADQGDGRSVVRLEQVLINLLQNATEALEGRPDPSILIAVRKEKKAVVVEVSDNGPGVPPNLQGPDLHAVRHRPAGRARPRPRHLDDRRRDLPIQAGVHMSFSESEQIVVLVDDDVQLRQASVQSLELAGMNVRAFADAQSALDVIGRDFDGVLVTDIRMPRMDGLQLFEHVKEIDAEIPVIIMTGHADVPVAVRALQDGAFDFQTKPFAVEQLVASIRNALEKRRLVLDNRLLRAATSEGDSPLIGDTPVMVKLRETIAQIAQADIDVLIEGETGTGKELVAVLLHRQSRRRGRPFIAVNCGALPDSLAELELFGRAYGVVSHDPKERVGRIETSNSGTLFLDEIDSTSPAVQAHLLRVVEEREVVPIGAREPRALNLRVIAASKSDLGQTSQAGRFPRGSLLSAQRGAAAAAAAAGTPRRYPPALLLFRRHREAADGNRSFRHGRSGAASSART